MTTYTTQMDAARKGIITAQMEQVALEEQMDINELMAAIAKGSIIIPANKNHKNLSAKGVGKGLATKINVNLGISKDCCNIDKEMEKALYAVNLKADAIMDLSCYGKTREFRKKLVELSPVMIGTVPIYDAVGFYDKNLKDISVDEFFDVVEVHAQDGVDFMTIHAGLNRAVAEKVKKNERLTAVVSRGGSLLFRWMELNDR